MIIWKFDDHVCTACAGKVSHVIGQVEVAGPRAAFNLRCTGCGDEDGPFAGERYRDEHGNWLRA